jgi:hypothetical protein
MLQSLEALLHYKCYKVAMKWPNACKMFEKVNERAT